MFHLFKKNQTEAEMNLKQDSLAKRNIDVSEEEKEQRIKNYVQLAEVLSDYHAELHEGLMLYIGDQFDEFSAWLMQRSSDDEAESVLNSSWNGDLYELVLDGLVHFGFVGRNDWKFSLEEFVLHAEPAYQYYNIPLPDFEDIQDVGTILAPRAFYMMQDQLPSHYGLAVMDDTSDGYCLIVAPLYTLKLASAIGSEIGIDMTIIGEREENEDVLMDMEMN